MEDRPGANRPLTLAVLGDVHFGDPPPIAARRGEFGDELLTRAVERFNRFVRPDLVVVLGDLLDEPDSARADADLASLRAILDRLSCPWLVIPGNHDPDPQRFYEALPRPAERTDVSVAGQTVRFLPFVDPEEPGYHARRTSADLARLRGARSDGFTGSVIALQHVPLRPRGAELAFTFTNLDEVLEATEAGGVDLCLAAHAHQVCDLARQGRCRFFAAPALCEHPHPYALLTVDRKEVGLRIENLAMPAEWGLIDCHSHTQFAYCAETVHTERSPDFAQTMGLAGLALTEHSGQLYFPSETYWSGRFCEAGVDAIQAKDCRMEDYFKTVEALDSRRLLRGLEVDADFRGEQVLLEAHRQRAALLIGAVHFLPERLRPAEDRDPERFVAQFRAVTERLCRTGIHVLAHPFRIFRRAALPVPRELYPWLATLLRDHAVAAEINFHGNEPHEQFVQLCLEMGVKLSFGGDAHALWEVGEFYPHLKLLERLGAVGDPSEVLFTPAQAGGAPR